MSEYNKFDENIFDSVNENILKLSKIFPCAVKDGKVDFKALKEELGEFESESEKYEFTWTGKQNAKKLAQTDLIGKTLKYIETESKNAETTKNIYIEGENLESLKLLRQNYYSSVKMIYIDPPYNTGSDLIYNDNFKKDSEESDIEEGNKDKFGNRMTVNSKSSNRYHANWLNIMYPRLKIAKDLLTDEGIIFISIDDNEAVNLKNICDEIFGENNFVSQITVVSNPRGRDYGGVARMHEYILIYKKSEFTEINLIEDKEKEFKLFDEIGGFELRELRNRNVKFNKENRRNLYYPFYINADNKDENGLFEISIEKKKGWIELYPLESQGINTVWRWGKPKAEKNLNINIKAKSMKNGGYQIVEKYRESKKMVRSVWWDKESNTEKGTLLVKEILGGRFFDYPKPLEMIMRLCEMGTNPENEDIVLDFFSGSGTTAHAVMQLNAKDGGNRKFIMIQCPEPCKEESEAFKNGYKNICDIGKERIKKAGEIINKNNNLTDTGFKVFKVSDTNIRWIKVGLEQSPQINYSDIFSDKDKLDFTENFTDIDIVYEIMLRQRDIHLSSEVKKLDNIGKRTYSFADKYIVCLEENITNNIIEELSKIEPFPIKYVLRDSTFNENISFKDETMRKLDSYINKNKAKKQNVYTVEFI